MAEWSTVTLNALAAPVKSAFSTGPFGSAVSAKNFRSDGVPMLRGSNLSEDVGIRLDDADLVYLSPDLASQFTRSTVRPGDLVFTCWGTVGQIGLIDDAARYSTYIVSNKQMKMTPDRDKVDPLFLYYNLSQPQMLDLVKSQAIGSSVPGFNLGQLRILPVTLPSRSEQQAIADVLGALDDKITANAATAVTALRLARSHFERALLQNLRWSRLGEIATTALGGTPSKANAAFWRDGTVPWLASGKANEERVITPTTWISEAALAGSATRMMPRGATLIAITGATLGQVARLEINACGNQSLVGAWADDTALNDWLLFAIQSEMPKLLRRATGAAQQHVNKNDVKSLMLPILEEGGKLEDWGATVRPILDLARQCDIEYVALAETRDALLPQLMSGRIRVKDAERAVGEVV